METLEVRKEGLGLHVKKFSVVLVVIFIALPLVLINLYMYRYYSFDLIGSFARSKVQEENTQHAKASVADSTNASYPPKEMPNGTSVNGVFVPAYGNGSSPQGELSPRNSLTDATLLNGSSDPGFGQPSGSRNDSTEPDTANVPDGKLTNQHLAGAYAEGSDYGNRSSQLNGPSGAGPVSSRNDSSEPTRMDNGKYLNGLLAPGFDEGSCLSRYMSFLYRKSSPHKPSSYLLSKLRKYENLHEHCGPFTKSYNRSVKELQSNLIGKSRSCKYIVWIGSNGMGNRIISMASAFLYALLTNRVLLVDHRADMTDLFCEPFPNASWLLPVDFPLRKHFHRFKARRAYSSGSMRRENVINSSKELPPSFVFLSPPHLDCNLDQLFLCDQNQALLQKVPWLILSSDQYFSPSFFLVQSFKQEVSKLFPEKDTVFHNLGRYLFHPSNDVWRLVTKFYDAHLAKVDERIGLQVRVFSSKNTPYQLVMDQILACTQKTKLLPDLDTKKSPSSHSRKQISKAVLIASLTSRFYENISSMYFETPTVTGEVIRVYQPSHEEYQHKGDSMHNMKAWAEMYLLSLSDVLVTSAGSTFGYVAQGLGGLKPWILIKPQNRQIPDPPCQKDISMEPCFHYPPSYFCDAKEKVDSGSLAPYVRHCEDRKRGLLEVTVEPEALTAGTILTVIFKNDCSSSNKIPSGELLPAALRNGSDHEIASKNFSSQSTGMSDDKILLSPGLGNESSANVDSSGPTTVPDKKHNSTPTVSGISIESDSTSQDLKTSKIGFSEESSSRKGSSQHTDMAKDKLLDGLLAPGFDEGSCLSRYQSFLYRKSSPHKPSPYLLSKLRDYENLHKRCGPYTKHYSEAVKGLKSGHSSSRDCKYIAWIPANGLGNRMISLASTFLYAILTNRVLLGQHKHDMADVFCEPFPNSSWTLPTKFPLRSYDNVQFRHAHGYGTMLVNANRNLTTNSPPFYLYLNLDHSDFDLDKRSFYCDQTQAFLHEVPWLFLISDQYFAPSFFLIPSLKEEVSKMFPDKETIFFHLGRYLFHPSNKAWGLITRFYQAYLAKADEKIGLQIRVPHPKNIPFESITETILACTLKEKLLPEVDTQSSVVSPSENRTSKAIMIASLYPTFYENISSMYLSMPTVTGEVISVHQPSHEEYQHFGDSMHNIKALADIYLLSLTDVLVTSGTSTFGYVAQGLGALKPWILHKLGKEVPHPACVQDISHEPCFHYPPNYNECETNTTIDAGAVYPYLRHCKDHHVGVKLVRDQDREQ
ncbi:hypothetical protein Tsubulata_006665 [Turnera subulata]|uniref:Fucosyltransferase n=1 Tax=Turnera subulata TaxID=218843 RepID=A0A9Q0FL29_9ROSI|nr:hypothetical protein Tsubulata_006665 [Turnera subulata]